MILVNFNRTVDSDACGYSKEDIELNRNAMYNKAIDDFVSACNKQFATMYGQRYIDMRNIKEIAEQLKAGGENEQSI